MLTAGSHGDLLVIDLGSDLADGTLLIKILQVASKYERKRLAIPEPHPPPSSGK